MELQYVLSCFFIPYKNLPMKNLQLTVNIFPVIATVINKPTNGQQIKTIALVNSPYQVKNP